MKTANILAFLFICLKNVQKNILQDLRFALAFLYILCYNHYNKFSERVKTNERAKGSKHSDTRHL